MHPRPLDRSTLFSIIIPVFNEEETLPQLFDRMTHILGLLPVSAEVVLVNDGSRDRSLELMVAQARKDERFRSVDLSRNFGHQPAVCAGMAVARGHVAAILDADLQDPPEVLEPMLQRWADGVDVVYGQRRARTQESRFKLFTAWLFYRILSWLASTEIPKDTGDFRVVDRAVLDVVNRMPEQHKFLRGMFAWVGFEQEAFLYDREARVAGTTKYPLQRMLKFSVDGILSFSIAPLRLILFLGLVITMLAFGSAVYLLVLRLTHAAEFPPGIAGLFVTLLFMFGFNFICLGIIGEYIGRNFVNIQGRPTFVIRHIFERPRADGAGGRGSGANSS